jgi:hypothetical protein
MGVSIAQGKRRGKTLRCQEAEAMGTVGRKSRRAEDRAISFDWIAPDLSRSVGPAQHRNLARPSVWSRHTEGQAIRTARLKSGAFC